MTSPIILKAATTTVAKKKRSKMMSTFLYNIWEDNPIFRMVLGICSSLAVTNLVFNTFIMGFALIFVTAFSSLLISLIRSVTPHRVRMGVYTVVIAAFVIVVDIILKVSVPDVSKMIGAYVGLIITNCIVMGRAEAFAAKNGPILSFVDGLGAGIGYTFVLLSVSIFREILGMGTLLKGSPLELQVMPEGFVTWVLMVMPTGAFLLIGSFIGMARFYDMKRKKQI